MKWLRLRRHPIRNNRYCRMAIEETVRSCRQKVGQRIATRFVPTK
jgi:hypothetical protein